jgi:hypothetical protein
MKQRLAWLNAKVRCLLYAVEDGKLPASELDPWAKRLAILDAKNIEHLASVLGRPKAWASTQLTLNSMQPESSRKRVLHEAFDNPFLKVRGHSARAAKLAAAGFHGTAKAMAELAAAGKASPPRTMR